MTIRERLDQWLDAQETTLDVLDGFDEAILGVAQVFNHYIVIYDREKCIEILLERDGMTGEEADEYFEFNIQGAYVGEQTPGIMVWKADEEE